MTALDDRPIAPAVPPRPARRTPSDALHADLITASNLLLDAAGTSEWSALDALSLLVGALVNAMPPSSRPLSKHGLIDLVGRVAGGLGGHLSTNRSTTALMQALKDYPDEIEHAMGEAIAASRAFKEARGSMREELSEAEFETTVLDLAELGIGAGR